MCDYMYKLFRKCIVNTSDSESNTLHQLLRFDQSFADDEKMSHEALQTCRADILNYVINNEEKIDHMYIITTPNPFELECISHLHHIKTIVFGNESFNIDMSGVETILITNNTIVHPDLDMKNVKTVFVTLTNFDNVVSSEDGFYTIGKMKLPIERHIELDLNNFHLSPKEKCKDVLYSMITHSVPISKIIYVIDEETYKELRSTTKNVVFDYFLVEYKRRVNPDVTYNVQGFNFHKLFPMYHNQRTLQYIKNIGSKLFLNLPKITVFSIFKIMREKIVYRNNNS